MKNYPHIVSLIYEEPALITPEKHRAIQRIFEARMAAGGIVIPGEDGGEPEPEPEQIGSQIIIPIRGIIGKGMNCMSMMSGGFNLDYLSNVLDDVEDDDSISEVLLNFDSPGGTVTGVPEMAARIAAIDKHVTSVTEVEMCSAAYYLAAGADEIYCTSSARVGSIGVYAVYMDYSRALENEGIKVNPISSGKDKLMGAWFKPMTEAEQKILQAEVTAIHEDFKAHVMAYRQDNIASGTMPDDALQGRAFRGEEALANGLVDGVIDSISELLR